MFLKVGHRGARAYEVENTLESFRKAITLGANAIELDVREAKDGTLIVSHDDNLKKVFGKDVDVKEATLKELKKASGGAVPAFGEALRFADGNVEKILVELKEAGYEKKALEVIKKEKLTDRVILVSFHEEALSNVRKLDKGIETGLIYARHKNPVDAALKLGAQYLLPLYRFTHTRNVENAHTHNLKVIVWTINTEEEVKKYIAKGVDGIASDRPDIFKSLG
ncbi:MAG TPA: glycerophosphodiester phosphodiesterase [Thermodesulfovibrionales bacterium]|nr:glycerophosphodiester phosphodiesterase [Thermodesulfovibrionales bacterium]